jgi:hypothetical protein
VVTEAAPDVGPALAAAREPRVVIQVGPEAGPAPTETQNGTARAVAPGEVSGVAGLTLTTDASPDAPSPQYALAVA